MTPDEMTIEQATALINFIFTKIILKNLVESKKPDAWTLKESANKIMPIIKSQRQQAAREERDRIIDKMSDIYRAEGGVVMQRVTYDGTAASVDKIMDIVGTSGVNNTNERFLILPDGECAKPGDSIVSEKGFWWVETKKRMKEDSLDG